MLAVAAALMLAAACAPKAGKTTQVVGQFAENAPETVRIVLGESVDTTVTVTDGRFAVAIPTDLCDGSTTDSPDGRKRRNWILARCPGMFMKHGGRILTCGSLNLLSEITIRRPWTRACRM